jgi:hypothetical protein
MKSLMGLDLCEDYDVAVKEFVCVSCIRQLPVMDMSPDCMLCIYSIIQVVEAEVKNLNLQP